LKKAYTMMHGQKNIKFSYVFVNAEFTVTR